MPSTQREKAVEKTIHTTSEFDLPWDFQTKLYYHFPKRGVSLGEATQKKNIESRQTTTAKKNSKNLFCTRRALVGKLVSILKDDKG